MKRFFSCLTAMLLLVAIPGTAYFIYDHLSYQRRHLEEARGRLQTLTQKGAGEVDAILKNVMTSAQGLANDLSTGRLARDDAAIKKRVREVLARTPYVRSCSVCFAPYAHAPGVRLYSHRYVRTDKDPVYHRLESLYDYTEHDWFKLPLSQNRSQWIGPFFGKAAKTLVTDYCAVFYRADPKSGKRVPAGIVNISISLDQIKRIVAALDLGQSGFGALVSGKGQYIFHPNNKYLVENKSVTDVAHELNGQDRLTLGARIAHGETLRGIIDHDSTTTGLASWLAYEPIPSAGWTLLNTYIKSDVPSNGEVLRRQLFRITILAVISFLAAIGFVISSHGLENKEFLWLCSVASSLVILSAIGVLWYLSLSYNAVLTENSSMILDKTSLGKIKGAAVERSGRLHLEAPIFIPTGIQVASLRLTPDNVALLSGHVWQRYDQGVPRTFAREISFASADSLKLTEPYSQREGCTEVVRWKFQAEVRQPFKSEHYPLDSEIASIRIVQKDLQRNVVLVPDLSSYAVINPSFLPGLDRELGIPGWSKKKTFFSLESQQLNSNLGTTSSVLSGDIPALKFNVVVTRNFIDSFISNVTPLIVVAIVLFIALMMVCSSEKVLEKTKVGISLTLGMSSTLFFVVVFAHIGVRQRIQAQDMFYLEYFYLIIYLTIMWVTVSTIIFTLAKNFSLLQFKENIFYKVLYWPVLYLMILMTTVHVFY